MYVLPLIAFFIAAGVALAAGYVSTKAGIMIRTARIAARKSG